MFSCPDKPSTATIDFFSVPYMQDDDHFVGPIQNIDDAIITVAKAKKPFKYSPKRLSQAKRIAGETTFDVLD